MRYLFMGTPPIATEILQSLVKAGYHPEAVVTQPPKPAGRGQKEQSTDVARYARQMGWPVHEVKNVNTPELLRELKNYEVDLVFVVAFGQILKAEVLALPKLFCLNVHASLLPAYRGAGPVQWAIWKGEKETGVTIQKMVRELDAGDIFLQKRVPIDSEETSAQLLKKLALLGSECAVDAFKKCERKDYSFTPQDPQKVTYAPKIEKEQAAINWSQSAQEIKNQIRALQPWPVASTVLQGSRLLIFGCEVLGEKSSAPSGSLKTDGSSYLHVACGDGSVLALTVLQLENRKRLAIGDFLRGYSITTTRL